MQGMDASPPPPSPPESAAERSRTLPSGWWIGLTGVLVGLLGLGAAFWALRDHSEVTAPVPVIEEQAPGQAPLSSVPASGATAGTGTASGTGTADAPGTADTPDMAGEGQGYSALLELDIPTGFPPPQLQSLSFADAFAQAAAYRGWQCQQTEVILFSDARQALPAVQEQLLTLGYQVNDTETALGEDRSWLAQHPGRADLFGSFSSGEEGRGNVSVCSLPS